MKTVVIFLLFFNFTIVASATPKSTNQNLQLLCDAACEAERASAADPLYANLLFLCNHALQPEPPIEETSEKENRAQVNIPEIAITQELPPKKSHAPHELMTAFHREIHRFQHINDRFFELLSEPVAPQILENLQRAKLETPPELLLWQIQREPLTNQRQIFLNILEGKKPLEKCRVRLFRQRYSTEAIIKNHQDSKDLQGSSQSISLPPDLLENLMTKKPRENIFSEEIFTKLANAKNLKHAKWVILYLHGMSQPGIAKYCFELPSMLSYVLEKFHIPYERPPKNQKRDGSRAKRIHIASAEASASGLATSES